ncbi:Glutamate--tRNA ligase [Actinidia chinensis var. chinensis]|uniref:Glutamate--tRNA ligase n=1 Tax=Actinidia chinensis var. chinensis TaxID=1590841 RepID=A0A2R6RXP9_ACTCC|nr:Glutamate--tRNA ligase [Actinidia chinensis var. chinensis]
MSHSFGILYYYSGTIISTDHEFTCSRANNEFLNISTMHVSLIELSRMLYEQIGWNSSVCEVEIIWKMQNGGRYVDVPIGSDKTLSSMFGFAIANRSQMVELYLTNRPREGNKTVIECTVGPSDLGGNARELMSVQKIINREPRLGMTSAPYCCGEIEVSDEEDDRNVDKVEEDEPIIQFMTHPAPKFEDVSREAQATCSDWSCSHSLLGISDDELQVGQQFRDKSQYITAVKRWHIKNGLQFKVHRQLKLV